MSEEKSSSEETQPAGGEEGMIRVPTLPTVQEESPETSPVLPTEQPSLSVKVQVDETKAPNNDTNVTPLTPLLYPDGPKMDSFRPVRPYGHKKYLSDGGVIVKSRQMRDSPTPLPISNSEIQRHKKQLSFNAPAPTHRKNPSLVYPSKLELGEGPGITGEKGETPSDSRRASRIGPMMSRASSIIVERIVRPWYRRLLSLLKAVIVPVTPPPEFHRPRPLFPKVTAMCNKYAPRNKYALPAFYLTWFTMFVCLTHFNTYATSTDVGKPENADCYASFWRLGDGCGVNGQNCVPFTNKTSYLRCFGDCDLAATLNDVTVGSTKVPTGSSYVIGNSSAYRADSWVCAAAIQSGVIHPRYGGCIAVDFIGEMLEYFGDTAHGIKSLSFPSKFPKSYTIRKVEAKFCYDYSWFVLPINIIMACLSTLFQPSKRTFWFTMTILAYYHCIFFSDPSDRSDAFISASFGSIFSTLAISYFGYRMGGKKVVPDFDYPLDRSVLFVPALFFGLLINKWSIGLPQVTLTPDALHDSAKVTAIIVGGVILLVLIVYQLIHIRRLRLLPWYLLGYVVFAVGYAILPFLLVLKVHLHHWLFAIVLWPLTVLRIRISVVYQAALLGLFVNGVARWGLASPLETYIEDRSYGLYGSPQASWTFNATQFPLDHTLHWRFIPEGDLDISWLPHTTKGDLLLTGGVGDIENILPGMWVHGYSLVMNDFEIYRGQRASFNVNQIFADLSDNQSVYFRLALTSEGVTLDYSPQMACYKNGTCVRSDGTKYHGYVPTNRNSRWQYIADLASSKTSSNSGK